MARSKKSGIYGMGQVIIGQQKKVRSIVDDIQTTTEKKTLIETKQPTCK